MKKSVSHLQAIGLAITGFALWVLSDTCMKLTAESTLPSYEIIGFMGFFGVVAMVIAAFARGKMKTLWPKNPRQQSGRGLISIATNVLNVIALNHLPLTLFYVAVFTAPMMTAVLAGFFGHERLRTGKILAIICGFAGVIIALDPFHDLAHGDWIGYVAAFASAFCWAANTTWLRVMTQSESGASIVFFSALAEMLFGFLIMILWHSDPLTLKLVLLLVPMGILSVAGSMAVYAALKYTTSTNVSQFHYTQIITGAFFGYLIWNEMPTAHLLIGIAAIIGAGLYIAHHARKTEKLASIQPL